jgi:hypothetical protein
MAKRAIKNGEVQHTGSFPKAYNRHAYKMGMLKFARVGIRTDDMVRFWEER